MYPSRPGRVLFPKLQELALAYKDVIFIKVDVDELEVRLACLGSVVLWSTGLLSCDRFFLSTTSARDTSSY